MKKQNYFDKKWKFHNLKSATQWIYGGSNIEFLKMNELRIKLVAERFHDTSNLKDFEKN